MLAEARAFCLLVLHLQSNEKKDQKNELPLYPRLEAAFPQRLFGLLSPSMTQNMLSCLQKC